MASTGFKERFLKALDNSPDEATRQRLRGLVPDVDALTLKDLETRVQQSGSLAAEEVCLLAWLLGRVGEESTVGTLMRLFATESHSDVRAEAITSISLLIWGTTKEHVVPIFVAALHEPSPVVATAGAHGLRAIHNVASVRALQEAVTDSRLLPEIRGYAAESLGEVIDALLGSNDSEALTLRAEAEQILLTACRSVEPELVYWSLFALALCGTRTSLVDLGHVLRSHGTDWDARIEHQLRETTAAIEGRG